jgi:short-chain fatty acids transporter
MLERMGRALTGVAQRWLPDPFVLAILLTFVAFAGALLHVGLDVGAVLSAWYDGKGGGRGFWNLLAFAMQMCLILVTGHALATSPPVRRLLDAIAARATSAGRAIVVVSLSAMVLAYLNWGLGLVAGAILAREVGLRARARGVRVHYPLLAAAGYSGMLVWHGGLSGSAPLKVTQARDLVEILGPELAAQVGPIGLGRTLASPGNLLANALLLALVPLVLVKMLPRDASERQGPPDELTGAAAPPAERAAHIAPAARLDRSRGLVVLLVIAAVVTLGLVVRRLGVASIDPNVVNFAFLFAGLLLHGSARAYVDALTEATSGCAGILLQFPFYAGIMGVLTGTGLLAALSGAFASTGAAALPAASFYAAGLVNVFVPSGGGQWAVQGPVLVEAALRTGVDPAKLVMALSYGDQWTNMLQPFWALPLLGITRVRASDVIGYTAVLLVVSQAAFLAGLYLL